jgi:hypothetical protein
MSGEPDPWQAQGAEMLTWTGGKMIQPRPPTPLLARHKYLGFCPDPEGC